MNVLVIQGPNINMLGVREKSTYGALSMEEIHQAMGHYASEHGIGIDFFQSNSEGEIVSRIHDAYKKADYIIINPAAYTHTSVAIRDALLAVNVGVVEVHISNVYKREDFRKRSFISDIAIGVLSGFGAKGYLMALDFIRERGEA